MLHISCHAPLVTALVGIPGNGELGSAAQRWDDTNSDGHVSTSFVPLSGQSFESGPTILLCVGYCAGGSNCLWSEDSGTFAALLSDVSDSVGSLGLPSGSLLAGSSGKGSGMALLGT